jgi:transcriptional regulator with XRE-family HTH domain
VDNIKNVSSDFIKNSRIKIGMSQETLVGKLNLFGLRLDKSAISKIENSTMTLYYCNFCIICKMLNIGIKLFFDINLISKVHQKYNPFIKKMLIILITYSL